MRCIQDKSLDCHEETVEIQMLKTILMMPLKVKKGWRKSFQVLREHINNMDRMVLEIGTFKGILGCLRCKSGMAIGKWRKVIFVIKVAKSLAKLYSDFFWRGSVR